MFTMFFSIPVTSGVGFVASVTSGLICWGLLIFSNNIELTVLTLLDENGTELDDDITVFYKAVYSWIELL